MAVAGTDAALAQHLRDLQRELVLARRRAAVRHLYLVDQREHRHPLAGLLGRHIERWPPVAPEVDRIEEMAERVRHSHEAADLIEHAPQFRGATDARNIPL